MVGPVHLIGCLYLNLCSAVCSCLVAHISSYEGSYEGLHNAQSRSNAALTSAPDLVILDNACLPKLMHIQK